MTRSRPGVTTPWAALAALLLTASLSHGEAGSLKVSVTSSTPGGPEIHALFQPSKGDRSRYQLSFLTNACHPNGSDYARWFPPDSDTYGEAGAGSFLYRMLPLASDGHKPPCKVEIVVSENDREVASTTIPVDANDHSVSDSAQLRFAVANYVVEGVAPPSPHLILRILLTNPSDGFQVAVLTSKDVSEACKSFVDWDYQTRGDRGLDHGLFQLPPKGWAVVTLPLRVTSRDATLSRCTVKVGFGLVDPLGETQSIIEKELSLEPSGYYKRAGLH